jgi:hypothetical protein
LTNTEKIKSSKKYETQRIISVTDEIEATDKKLFKEEPYTSANADINQTFNEGFSFGGSEKEDSSSKTPKKSLLSSQRGTQSNRRKHFQTKSLYSNKISPSRVSINSSEEYITCNKYFLIDSGINFEPYEFKTHGNQVIVLDKFFKKLCYFQIPSNSSNNSFSSRQLISEQQFYSLTEKFRKMSPFISLDKYLIFYTASQFIAFNYR